MAELSSNWKKLQAKLKTESAAKPSLKRKPTEAAQPASKRAKTAQKPAQESSQKPSHRPGFKAKHRPNRNHRPMGAVQSTRIEQEPKHGVSPSLALWAAGSDISAEALAEAYDLGVKDHSMISPGTRDRLNHGLTEGVDIGKYVAIDCEMVGVGPGGYESALARVSIVDFHGKQVYDSYVKPKERVTNWRTEVSGISTKEMRFARDFEEVQKDVDAIFQNRILVGHDLKHDLEALKLSHPPRDIRDTAKYPPFRKYGNGRKPSLRNLAQELLSIEIQSGAHSSVEDARVTMLLFRRHKPGFDVDHANRYPTIQKGKGGSGTKGKKPRFKRKA
ncbi:unnamed protein product [Clonostachys rosea]|uniref:RNA exonuclease 4 n=1 Tax=Bionectria ochroleuca TaxID=29856 RepID=A0ABY6TPW8_BIOOC|nr:unnamed protein product [Clonostachys rosea]